MGHSNRTLEAFVELLRAGDVELVVDIRTVPRSRHNPQFNADAMEQALRPHRIGYARIESLGGLRGKSKTVPPEVNAFWTNASFHNYADYALSPEFRAGLSRLLELGGGQRAAIMCAEAVWWRCHRRIVADYLLHAGREVLHLMGDHRIEPARMTEAAVPAADGIHYAAKPGSAVPDGAALP
ncbi:MAG TPA: DUF488 domain-containing protein [Burkholderiaceae bacterium]|nr:DUF488 domain-containing protein [Burkholderiaceae bacterium]